jgi:hypothetical protein
MRRLTFCASQARDDCQQISDRLGEAIELGTDELVSFAYKVECGFKLLAFSDRGNLLAKDALASGCSSRS